MDIVPLIAHLRPLHDTRSQRQMVLSRISALEGDLKGIERMGQGPRYSVLN